MNMLALAFARLVYSITSLLIETSERSRLMYHIKLKKLDCTSELEMDSNDLILYYILHESPANSKVHVIM